MKFHRVLAEASGRRPRLNHRGTVWPHGATVRTVGEHGQVLAAVRVGDPDAAAAAARMANHLLSVEDFMRHEQPADDFGEVGRAA